MCRTILTFKAKQCAITSLPVNINCNELQDSWLNFPWGLDTLPMEHRGIDKKGVKLQNDKKMPMPMCVVWCENLDIQITSENVTSLNILHNYDKVFEVSSFKNIYFTTGIWINLRLRVDNHPCTCSTSPRVLNYSQQLAKALTSIGRFNFDREDEKQTQGALLVTIYP